MSTTGSRISKKGGGERLTNTNARERSAAKARAGSSAPPTYHHGQTHTSASRRSLGPRVVEVSDHRRRLDVVRHSSHVCPWQVCTRRTSDRRCFPGHLPLLPPTHALWRRSECKAEWCVNATHITHTRPLKKGCQQFVEQTHGETVVSAHHRERGFYGAFRCCKFATS